MKKWVFITIAALVGFIIWKQLQNKGQKVSIGGSLPNNNKPPLHKTIDIISKRETGKEAME